MKNKTFLSSFLLIHRRQPHHAFICLYIYHARYVVYFIYNMLVCVYQNDVLYCTRNALYYAFLIVWKYK